MLRSRYDLLLCKQRRSQQTLLTRGGTGTRWLPGSGRVLHYPALPGPGWILLQSVARSGYLSRFLRLSTTCNVVKRQAGICLATFLSLMHDTVASRVTNNCLLVASRGMGDGNLPRDGLISQLTRHIASDSTFYTRLCAHYKLLYCIVLYILTNEAITQRDSRLRCFPCSIYCPLASVCVYTTGPHYIIQ